MWDCGFTHCSPYRWVPGVGEVVPGRCDVCGMELVAHEQMEG